MNGDNWKNYTDTGNNFFYEGQLCCAFANYQKALNEAEVLLMNSFSLEKEVPVIRLLLVSYQNIFAVFNQTGEFDKLQIYFTKATKAMVGILKSCEFPDKVQDNCSADINKLYHVMSSFCSHRNELAAETCPLLTEIAETVRLYLNYSNK